MAEYRIAIDVMGGDNAPGEILAGCRLALEAWPDLRLTLCGPEDALRSFDHPGADKVVTTQVIDMHEAPVLAVRKKPDSSLVRAMMEVREKRADAVVSAGSTGAILAGGMVRIGRIKGVERPALATVMPGRSGPVLLLDVGANVDCQSAYLDTFALMGSIYMEHVMHIPAPKVGLANIGTEAEKGNRLAKEAFACMSAQSRYSFAGNIEAREITGGDIQVVVLDGFDGNLILKYAEGFSRDLIGMLKDELMKDMRSKLGALLLKPAFARFKKRMDYREYGGAPLLGVEGAVIKAHGASDAKAFCSAIRQARSMLESDVTGKIREGVQSAVSEEEQEHGGQE